MVDERQMSIADMEGAMAEVDQTHYVAWVPDAKEPYQMFPPLPEDVYEALKESIRQHGVSQAVEVDEEGDTLDGHHRFRICSELGVPCPIKVISHLKSPQEKRDYARSVNCSRREVTTDMKKQQARQMLLEDASRYDSEIARIVGLSYHTVGSVRLLLEQDGKISNIARPGTEQVEQEEEEGPDLSFLESGRWQPWHRMEALSHLQPLGKETKRIACEVMNDRARDPKDALAMLAVIAGFGEGDRDRLQELWDSGEESRRVLVITRLLGSAPAPDPAIGIVGEAVQQLRRLGASRKGSWGQEHLAEALELLDFFMRGIRDQVEVW